MNGACLQFQIKLCYQKIEKNSHVTREIRKIAVIANPFSIKLS